MCGIIGVVTNKKNATSYMELVEKGIDKIKHRGPDHSNIFCNEDVCIRICEISY